MFRIMTTVMVLAALLLPAAGATRISNVKVDMVKGYAKNIAGGTDTSYYYMGRVTYNLIKDATGIPFDSMYVTITIVNQNTQQALPISEITGDAGIVKQNNSGDTLKAAYFRTQVVRDISGNYTATVTVNANTSAMWKLADTLMKQMSLIQRQNMTYAWTSSSRLSGFGTDNFTLGNGTPIIGWRSADGPHGVRFPLGPATTIAYYGAGDTMTLFPTEAALGCTWDTSVTRQVGQAIAKEARSEGVYCILGPMCDLVINPRWGRAFETMGEDPYLNGKMVASHVMGLQSEHVIATPKHFAAYVKETSRYSSRITVSERSFRELFCTPFEMALKDGGARAIMTCYNRVNVPGFTSNNPDTIAAGSEYAATNRHLIQDILRNDWGFDGVIMTDWEGAQYSNEKYVYDTDFDMSMPSGKGFLNSASNVNSGTWSATPLNNRARRCMYDRLWAWGGQLLTNESQINTYPPSIRFSPAHVSISLNAARKSVVLAKNNQVNGAPLLPLSKSGTYKVAVVGPFADMGRLGGGGSSAVTPDSMITPLQGIRRLLATNPNITVTTDYASLTSNDVAIVCVGVDKEGEDMDRPSMTLPTISGVDQNALVASVMAKTQKTIVVYTGGSASSAGTWSTAPGVLIAFYPGRNQGQAIAEVLFGDVNPSGHLNVTFPANESDLPSYELINNGLTVTSPDSAHGYFYYDKTSKTPLFRFGQGLSYTSFSYSDISIIGGTNIAAGDRFDVKVSVQNTGAVKGDDVVQLYVRPLSTGTIARRTKDLRGFSRISLAAGETQKAQFTLGPRDFSVYDTNTKRWVIVPGTYEILIGSTSDPAELAARNGKSVSKIIIIQ